MNTNRFEFPIKHPEFGTIKLYKNKYTNNNLLAIQLTCTDSDGFEEPLARLSVNPEHPLPIPSNCFYIKDWSENSDLVDWILSSTLMGTVFKERHDFPAAKYGFVIAPVWELLV